MLKNRNVSAKKVHPAIGAEAQCKNSMHRAVITTEEYKRKSWKQQLEQRRKKRETKSQKNNSNRDFEK